MDRNKYAAEFMGTFCLVFAGCGAITINDLYGGVVTHVGIAMTFGLIVLAMIYSIGNVSGAHMNPAVTIGFNAAGRLEKKYVMPYILSQCAGAICASIVLAILFDHPTLGSTLPSGSAMQAFVMEFLLTFMLMFVILNVSTGAMEKGIMAGVAVGGTVMLEALFAGPVTGASMNPARSLGPALLSGNLADLWIYLLAPTLGAWSARTTCRFIQRENCCTYKKC